MKIPSQGSLCWALQQTFAVHIFAPKLLLRPFPSMPVFPDWPFCPYLGLANPISPGACPSASRSSSVFPYIPRRCGHGSPPLSCTMDTYVSNPSFLVAGILLGSQTPHIGLSSASQTGPTFSLSRIFPRHNRFFLFAPPLFWCLCSIVNLRYSRKWNDCSNVRCSFRFWYSARSKTLYD